MFSLVKLNHQPNTIKNIAAIIEKRLSYSAEAYKELVSHCKEKLNNLGYKKNYNMKTHKTPRKHINNVKKYLRL